MAILQSSKTSQITTRKSLGEPKHPSRQPIPQALQSLFIELDANILILPRNGKYHAYAR